MSYRSMLFVPGDRSDRMSRAVRTGADAVVFDLQDAVTPERHAPAREMVAAALRPGNVDQWVRILDFGSLDADLDLRAAVQPGLTGVMLPRVDDPATVQAASGRIGDLEAAAGMPPGSVQLLPVPESALGLHRAFGIFSASLRVTVAVFAGAVGGDLCADLGADPAPGGLELLHARSHLLAEARAAGVRTVLDSVWADLDDHDGLRADSGLGRRLGFTGRLAIHPNQLPVLHEVYTASDSELAQAHAVMAAYAAGRQDGHGAVRHQGMLVDRATAARAERLLAEAAGRKRTVR